MWNWMVIVWTLDGVLSCEWGNSPGPQGSDLGPVLFNLCIRLLLETLNISAYADFSYYCGFARTNHQAQEEWIMGSGLKVNFEKTEMCIFHPNGHQQGLNNSGQWVESSHQIVYVWVYSWTISYHGIDKWRKWSLNQGKPYRQWKLSERVL